MIKYDPKSLKAEEFINDEEIRETLAKNDETYRQSQIKLLTEQLNRFTKQEQDDGSRI